MNNEKTNSSSSNKKYRNWSLLQQRAEKKETIEKVLKFHYKTLNRVKDEIVNIDINGDVLSWSGMVANQDILPDTYEDIIELDIHKHEQLHSYSKFRVDMPVELNVLGQLLYDAFGREAPYASKRYPSAGALYPVLPLLLVLESEDSNKLAEGCYIFDSTNARLFKICSWDNTEINKVKKLLNFDSNSHPPHCLAYALDMRRALTKYREKGYRHGLIEVGLMAQSFRESLQQVNGLGERCWSYFIDIPLTHICGLNFRLCPIMLIQWFGFSNGRTETSKD